MPEIETTNPLVSIAIASYDRCAVLADTIRQLYRQTYENIEVVVVDSSPGDSLELIVREEFPELKLIRMPQQSFYTAAINIAIANCSGKYVLLLDDDSFPGFNCIARAVSEMENENQTGIIAMGILNYDTFYNEKTYLASNVSEDHQGQEIFSFSGCGGFIRKDLFIKYGPIPQSSNENLPELHVCMWGWNEGYKIKAFKDIFVFHRLSTAGKPAEHRGSNSALLSSAKAVGLYFVRYYQSKEMLRKILMWYWALCNGVVVQKNFSYLNSLFSFLLELPETWKGRKGFSKDVTDKARVPNHFRGI